MRRMHRERECWSKWFGGIKCEYVNHSDASVAPDDALNQAPPVFILQGGDPDPAAAADGFDGASHVLPNALTFTIGNKLENDVKASFNVGSVLMARVASNWGPKGANGPLNRTSCRDFVDGGTCSQGEYVVQTVSWNVDVRLRKLDAYLVQPRTASELVLYGKVLDFFLLNEIVGGEVVPSGRRKGLAQTLLEHVKTHYPTVGGEPSQEQRDILAIAADLDPSNQMVQSAIVQNRIDSGLLREAQATNQKSLAALKSAYDVGARDASTLSSYAEALRQGGAILAKEYVGSNVDAVSAAAQLYERAVGIWKEYRLANDANELLKRTGIVEALVDDARTMRMVGGRGNIAKAVKALREARIELPREREGLIEEVAATGDMLATDDMSVIASGKRQVHFSFIPPNVVDVDPIRALGLYGSGKAYRRRDYRTAADTAVANTSGKDLTKAVLHGDGIAGMEKNGDFYIVSAAGEANYIADVHGAIWSLARNTDLIAYSAVGQTEVAFATLQDPQPESLHLQGDVLRLELSRDGKSLAVLFKGKDGKPSLSLIDLAHPDSAVVAVPGAGKIESLAVSIDGKEVLATGEGAWFIMGANGTSSGKSAAGGPYVALDAGLYASASINVQSPAKGATVRGLSFFSVTPPAAGKAASFEEEQIAFANELPAAGFAVLSGGAPITVGATSIPTTLRVYRMDGDISGAKPMRDWRPGAAAIAGDLLVGNSLSGSCAKAVAVDDPTPLGCGPGDTFGDATRTYAPSREEATVELVPLDDGGGYGLIGYRSDGSPASARIYGPSSTAPTGSASLNTGMHWKYLRTVKGPMDVEAGPMVFLGWTGSALENAIGPLRSDYDAEFAALQPIDTTILTLSATEPAKTVHIKLRDPDSVAASVGGILIQKRETGYAWVEAEGTLTYLDGRTDDPALDAGESLFVDSATVTVVWRDGDAISLKQHVAKGGALKEVWRYAGQTDPGAMQTDAIYPMGRTVPDFAFWTDVAKRSFLLAGKEHVLLDRLTETTNYPVGLPLFVNDASVIIQGKGYRFQIWDLKKP